MGFFAMLLPSRLSYGKKVGDYAPTMLTIAEGVNVVPARLSMPCSASRAAIARVDSPAWCNSHAAAMTPCSAAWGSRCKPRHNYRYTSAEIN